MTAMRENLAGIQSPFDATDPSATIDEMRARISRSATANNESRVAEADRQLELDRARAQVDELLLRYKEAASRRSEPPQPAAPVDTQSTSPAKGEEEAEQPKTLGRTDGPVRPID
jgi:hypothetical protein